MHSSFHCDLIAAIHSVSVGLPLTLFSVTIVVSSLLDRVTMILVIPVNPFAVAILISACFSTGALSGDQPKGRTVRAQSSWRIYSPPDRSFTVEVPMTPHRRFESYEGLDESTPGGLKPIHAYVAFVGLENPRGYFISVFKDTAPRRNPGDMGTDELFDLLTRKSNLLSTKEISVASGRARELTLVSKYTDYEFTRVRFIRVGPTSLHAHLCDFYFGRRFFAFRHTIF